MAEERTGEGAAVIHQFGFGTFNVAVSGGGEETLAVLHRPRAECFCCRGGSRALLNVWRGPKGN